MRRYSLASVDYRKYVDLVTFENTIINTVHQVMPNAVVTVEKDSYIVSPTPTRSEAVRIGRMLSSKDILGKYCIYVPKLFYGEDIEERSLENYAETKTECTGGHF